MAGEFRRDAQSVGHDRQLTPAAACLEMPGDRQRGGAGVEHDALAVAHQGCGRPPRCATSRRAGGARGPRRRVPVGCGRARWRRHGSGRGDHPPRAPTRSLRIVTAETPNCAARSVTRARPCSSTIRAIRSCRSRAKTSLAETSAGAVTPLLGVGHAATKRGDWGFVCFPTHSRPYRNAIVKKVIETNRNLWQSAGKVGTAVTGCRRKVSRGLPTTDPVAAFGPSSSGALSWRRHRVG